VVSLESTACLKAGEKKTRQVENPVTGLPQNGLKKTRWSVKKNVKETRHVETPERALFWLDCHWATARSDRLCRTVKVILKYSTALVRHAKGRAERYTGLPLAVTDSDSIEQEVTLKSSS
jgi:hypothetical protein